ncbi:MAG: hydrogenase nickel incorporation protein HypB [Bacillota bacterium]|jgi:hydrogenase nickel incorporation protein HypB
MDIKEVTIKQDIYQENDRIARITNQQLNEKGIFAINVMGSPGTGKTSSIIQIIKNLPEERFYVLEGDIESDLDTQTLKKIGVDAFQINTNGACHLDAVAVSSALMKMELKVGGILFIENIGNMVCPAEFQIGEHIKLLICSVTEGSDKPYKYPLIFEKADGVILNKVDLKPYLDFDEEFFTQGLRALNKKAPIFPVSGKTGEGFREVTQWLKEVSKIV